jgi:hypothetical protein
MSNTCEYCKGVFSCKSVLLQHQKKARYCLDIQLKLNPETIIINIQCQYCNKNFIRNCDKNIHEAICKGNKNNELLCKEYENKITIIKEEYGNKITIIKEEYGNKITIIKEEYEIKLKEKEKEINELKVKSEKEISKIYKELHESSKNIIDKIAIQPKTSNVSNNTVNIPTLNINHEHLSQAANNDFTRELFLQGQAGVAQFFMGYVKDINNGVVPFVVSDKSREVIKYKNKDQEIITDKKGNKLAQLAFNAIKIRNQEHYDSFYPNLTKNDDSDNYNSDDSDDDEDTESDTKQELADKCFVSIKKLPKDNTVFRKKIIEGCN